MRSPSMYFFGGNQMRLPARGPEYSCRRSFALHKRDERLDGRLVPDVEDVDVCAGDPVLDAVSGYSLRARKNPIHTERFAIDGIERLGLPSLPVREENVARLYGERVPSLNYR